MIRNGPLKISKSLKIAGIEWIGILSSDVPVVVMDLTRILCFGGGVAEFTLNVSRGAAFHRSTGPLFVHMFIFWTICC